MVKVTKIVRTCHACPAQWEGETEDGKFVYVRYRWGWLSVRIGETIDQAIAIGDEIVGVDHGDSFGGFMEYGELKGATAGKVEWPETETVADFS